PLEENNIELLDMTGLDQLEQQLNSFLQQVKIREAKIEVDTHGTWGNRDVSSIQLRRTRTLNAFNLRISPIPL
ncbi:hypothetical protein Tco_1472655, partial [Tanacetum coccineum]